jgi:hypothetical protein
MLKTALIAASLLVLGASGALAQEQMRTQHPDNSYGYSNSPEAFTGVNQYCGPGEIPEVFPFGTGVRCALPSGGYRYN